MISAGFGGLKSLRSALLTGYALLAAGWLLWPSVTKGVSFSMSASQLVQRATEIDLGSGTKLALVSFVATFIGTAANTLVVDRVIDWFEETFPGPWWDLYLRQGFDSSLYSSSFQLSTSDEKRMYVTNPHRAVDQQLRRAYPIDVSHPVLHGAWLDTFHWSTYEKRLRERRESRFRLHVLLAALVLAVPLGVEGGGEWWFVSVAVVAIAFVELTVHNRAVAKGMMTEECKRLLGLKSDAVAKVDEIKAQVAVSEDAYQNRRKPYGTENQTYDEFIAAQSELLERAKAKVIGLQAEIEVVEKHRFLKKNQEQITEM